MTIATPKMLFSQALMQTEMSAEDNELIERVCAMKREDPLPDDERDEVIMAVLKHSMRLGKSQEYIGFHDLNGPQLHVLAHRWREAGYDAEVKIGVPWYLAILLVSRTPGIAFSWDPRVLATQLAGEPKNNTPSE